MKCMLGQIVKLCWAGFVNQVTTGKSLLLIECEIFRRKLIPKDGNAADMVTRGVSIQQLMKNQLWWHGPSWLLQDTKYWP